MSAKIIALIVAVLVIAGGAYWYFSNGKTPTASQGATSGTEASQTQTGSDKGVFSGSLSDLITRGGSWQCTFDTTAAGGAKGTVYVSGSNLKGDFTSMANGTSVESHMIQTGGFVYVWSSLMPKGFKTKAAAGTPTSSYGSPSGADAMGQKYDYHCAPWAADASSFALPTGIDFMGY